MEDALKEIGLTEAQIEAIIAEYQSPEELAHATADDILTVCEEAGVERPRRGLVGRLLGRFASPLPQPQPQHPIEVRLNVDKAVHERRAAELLDILADPAHEDRELAAEEWDRRAGGLPAVVIDGEATDHQSSLQALKRAARGERLAFWGDKPVRTATELLDLAEPVDPLTGELLADGVNSRTLADWRKVSDDKRALAAYAQRTGLLEGTSPRDVARDLAAAGLDSFWLMVQNRFQGASEEIRLSVKRGLREQRAQRAQPTEQRGDQSPAAAPSARVVNDTLLRRFSLTEMVRLARFSLPEEITTELPGSSVSPAGYAQALVDVCVRRGLYGDLVAAIRRERPNAGI